MRLRSCGAETVFPDMERSDKTENAGWWLCGETATHADGEDEDFDAAGFEVRDGDGSGVKLVGWRHPFTWSEVEDLADGYGSTDDDDDTDGTGQTTEDTFA